jgi:hypothetical protein
LKYKELTQNLSEDDLEKAISRQLDDSPISASCGCSFVAFYCESNQALTEEKPVGLFGEMPYSFSFTRFCQSTH